MPQEKVEHKRKRARDVRLKPDSFSDIIFGLALSIGSLILIQNRVQVWQSFVWNIVLFGFSFAVIAMAWLSFSATIRYLSTEVPVVVFLTLALFFCVILEPYLFYMLMNGSGQLSMVISEVFAFDIGFMFFVLGILAEMVLKEASLNHPSYHSGDLETLEHMIYPRYVVGALFLISIVPFFWVSTPLLGHLRPIVWTSSIAVFLVYDMKVSFTHSNSKCRQSSVKKIETGESGKACAPRKEQEEDPLSMKRVFDPIEERWIFVCEPLKSSHVEVKK